MSWREREREERREKNAIYSSHLCLCLQPKSSARTPLGPTVPTSLFIVKRGEKVLIENNKNVAPFVCPIVLLQVFTLYSSVC